MKSTRALLIACFALLPMSAAATWSPVADLEDFDSIEFFVPQGDVLYVGSTLGLIYGSQDHGESWSVVGTGLEVDYSPVASMVIAGDWMIMSRSSSPVFNYRCYHDGQNWTEWTPLTHQDSEIHSMAAINESILAVLQGVVHRSDDFGATWTPLPLPPGVSFSGMFVFQEHIFASRQIINGGQIYRFEEQAQTWVPIGSDLGSSYVLAQTGFQNDLFVSVYHGGGIGTLWRSADFGDHWTQVAGLPTQQNLNGLAPVNSDLGLAIGASGASESGQSIYVSYDLQTWEGYTTDLPWFARPVNQLASHDGWLFKTGGSVTAYRAPQPQIPTSVEGGLSPAFTRGLAVEPNPFHATTRIHYVVRNSGPVDLTIYDFQGRAVRSLVTGPKQAGEYMSVWNGRDASGVRLGSGVYFVKSSGPGVTVTQKLLLID